MQWIGLQLPMREKTAYEQCRRSADQRYYTDDRQTGPGPLAGIADRGPRLVAPSDRRLQHERDVDEEEVALLQFDRQLRGHLLAPARGNPRQPESVSAGSQTP